MYFSGSTAPSPVAATSRAGRRWSYGFVAVLFPLVVVLAACSSTGGDVVVGEGDGVDPTAEATAQTEEPTAGTEPTTSSDTTPSDTTPTAVATPVLPLGAPACTEVPSFNAADTVSTACVGNYAVAPELFASNAGWHLFEAIDGVWTEIDYALTCCEPDEVPFTDLLTRNGLDQATVDQLCAASGVGPDSVTGCTTAGEGDEEPLIDATWLRVNGLGDHDFGATESQVMISLDDVFGAADTTFNATECGAGPMTIVTYDDFTVQFQDAELIGWFYTASTPALTTPSGVAPGIDEASLRDVYDGVQISESTLGTEFFFEVPAGFIGGFLENGIVTSLYAGTNCFFR